MVCAKGSKIVSALVVTADVVVHNNRKARKLNLAPRPLPSQGKEGMVTLVDFLDIGRTVLEGPIRFLYFTCNC